MIFNRSTMGSALLLSAFLVSCTGTFLSRGPKNHLSVVFYNVENLFDTLNTPGKHDGEFTPEGSKNWDSDKYWQKINNLALVLDSITGKKDAVIGLAEIESDLVLQDLCKALPGDWKYLHGESPDFRGIDVALLFRGELTFKEMKFVRVTLPDDPDFKTRFLQYNRFEWAGEEVLFVTAHFPSRRGGQAASEYKRIAAARQLRHTLDSMKAIHKQAGVVIMGDFNDEPADSSIAHYLGTRKEGSGYVNLMDSLKVQGLGSYLYRDDWNMLDQMIVSGNLLDGKKLEVRDGKAHIYNRPWLLQQVGDYKGYPLRTYGGRTYLGGYSDHLPVFLELQR